MHPSNKKASVAESNPRAESEVDRVDGLLSLALETDARTTAQWRKGDQWGERRRDEAEEGDKMAGNVKRKTKKQTKIGNRSNEHSDHMQMTNSLIEMPIN